MIRGGASACRAALRDVRAAVEELARLPRALSHAAAPDITRLLREEFTAGVDPYGRPWPPLRPATLAKGRRAPPLTATKALRDGTVARPMTGGRAGLVILIGRPYGAFAQVGFHVGRRRVPPRRILPNRGLPAAWRAVLTKRARELAQRAVARAGGA